MKLYISSRILIKATFMLPYKMHETYFLSESCEPYVSYSLRMILERESSGKIG